jgi:hypothetical protein
MPRQTLEILPRRFNPFPPGQPAKCFDLPRRKYKLSICFVDGVIAQLVERLNGIQEVRSSSLLGSTINENVEKSPCASRSAMFVSANKSKIILKKTVEIRDRKSRFEPARRRNDFIFHQNPKNCSVYSGLHCRDYTVKYSATSR